MRTGLSLIAMFLATDAVAEPIQLSEVGENITEGTVTIDASPQQIYDAVTDYANWPRLLSDVEKVRVLGGGRDDATVRFKSRALRHTVTVVFENVPGKSLRFRGIKGPPGGRARGEYVMTPIDGGKRTVVTARLYMDVVGAPSWFVRDKTIRAMRGRKLTADLQDVARRFALR
jgi:uncharacterized membrane protein